MNAKKPLLLSAIFSVLVLCIGCFTASQANAADASRADLTREARTALNRLYAETPEAKKLSEHAVGILVFPDILKAGLIVGGAGGNGVLFSTGGKVLGYYNAASVSFGLQAGAQDYSEAMFFTSEAALKHLDAADGWSVGTGPTVVLIDQGAAKDFTSTTLRDGVYAFIFGQQGLMGGIGVQGQKITKLEP